MLSQDALNRLCRARERLVEAREPSLSIGEIAREARMSPYHFVRRFAAVFGETPHQYRTTARLERAKRLLAAGMTVTDACVDVGFSSLGSFSELFTRRFGIRPSIYRRRTWASQVECSHTTAAFSCFSLMLGPQ